MVAWPGWLTVLNVPPMPSSAACSSHRARSRQSMYCSGSSAGPGASTSPPRSIRRSHHGIRPTISYGPRISPALASTVGPPKPSTAASSPPRLAAA